MFHAVTNSNTNMENILGQSLFSSSELALRGRRMEDWRGSMEPSPQEEPERNLPMGEYWSMQIGKLQDTSYCCLIDKSVAKALSEICHLIQACGTVGYFWTSLQHPNVHPLTERDKRGEREKERGSWGGDKNGTATSSVYYTFRERQTDSLRERDWDSHIVCAAFDFARWSCTIALTMVNWNLRVRAMMYLVQYDINLVSASTRAPTPHSVILYHRLPGQPCLSNSQWNASLNDSMSYVHMASCGSSCIAWYTALML